MSRTRMKTRHSPLQILANVRHCLVRRGYTDKSQSGVSIESPRTNFRYRETHCFAKQSPQRVMANVHKVTPSDPQCYRNTQLSYHSDSHLPDRFGHTHSLLNANLKNCRSSHPGYFASKPATRRKWRHVASAAGLLRMEHAAEQVPSRIVAVLMSENMQIYDVAK